MDGIIEKIEEGKVKRFFSSRNKLSYPGAAYHVTQRATGKDSLFIEDSDYLYMLHLIKEKSHQFDLDIFAFALMSNHVHLLFRLNKDNLSIAMKNIFEMYANYFNKKYQRKGRLFCGPYRCSLCLDDTYLLAASLYIHLNPCRANIAMSPSSYRWSSIITYIGDNRKTFINSQFILQLIDSDIEQARDEYRRLLVETITIKTKDILEEPKALEDFREKLKHFSLGKIFKKAKSELALGFDENEIDQKIELLRKQKRLTSPQQRKAREFLVAHLKSRGFSTTEISQKLGVSRWTIHHTLKTNLTK